ncbi:MAG: hypothetical protein JNJ54_31280 [Myxococcaceae bacterium]|nr:hypothetical protein [Myxococcaceae bacterium]
MASELLIRPLRAEDDRSSFTCGQGDLDRYLEHYAGQNQFKFGLSVTYVAVTAQVILGFATVCPGAIERVSMPAAARRRLPAYPLPVLRLARFGVATVAQGQGVGEALLRHVLGVALSLRASAGCLGVVADAKPDAVAFSRRYGFVPLEGVTAGTLHGEPTPMFLATASIPG